MPTPKIRFCLHSKTAATNEKLDELRLAAQKACRRLEQRGQLSDAALAPLLKETSDKSALSQAPFHKKRYCCRGCQRYFVGARRYAQRLQVRRSR